MSNETAVIRLRLSESDAHYGGGLVSGARLMSFLGDAVTWLAIDRCNDEGLLASWETVDFRKPLYPGDFISIFSKKLNESLLKSKYELTVYRDAISRGRDTSDCHKLDEPEVVAAATGTFVIPFQKAQAAL